METPRNETGGSVKLGGDWGNLVLEKIPEETRAEQTMSEEINVQDFGKVAEKHGSPKLVARRDARMVSSFSSSIYVSSQLSKSSSYSWKTICSECQEKGCRCIVKPPRRACEGCRAARRGCPLVPKRHKRKNLHEEAKDKEPSRRSEHLNRG